MELKQPKNDNLKESNESSPDVIGLAPLTDLQHQTSGEFIDSDSNKKKPSLHEQDVVVPQIHNESEDEGECKNKTESLESEPVEINNTAHSSAYDGLQLGLIQDIFFWLTGNVKKAVIVAVLFAVIVATLDTISDFLMFFNYLFRGFVSMAIVILIFEYLPAAVIFIHHFNSPMWNEGSLWQKLTSLILLVIHPFSLAAANMIWLLNINCTYYHHLARVSTNLHGAFEAPCQFILLTYAWSKNYLPLPWEERLTIVARLGNELYLGKIGLASLLLTAVGLIKASVEVLEIRSDKIGVFIYSAINLCFRLFSLSYVIQYYEVYSLPLLLIILITNSVIFLYNDRQKQEWIATCSSVLVSLFLPVRTSTKPHAFQISELPQKNSNNTMTSEDDNIMWKKRFLLNCQSLLIP